MKNRSNESLTRRQFVKSKLFKDIFITNAILILLLVFLTFPFNGESLIKFPNITLYFILIILADLFIAFVLNKFYKDVFDENCSVNFVNEFLSVEKYIEVVPIKASNYNTFILHLTEISKFYAIISEEDNKVIISVIFNNEKEGRFFESISKEFFTMYYKVK